MLVKQFETKFPLRILMVILILSSLAGCGQTEVSEVNSGRQSSSSSVSAETASSSADSVTEAQRTGTFFDTVISMRIFGSEAELWADEAMQICQEMEETLSAQRETSELYLVNHRTEQTVEVSEDLAECIRLGLYYSEISDGAFSISILPVKELWDFSTEDHSSSVPDEADIERELLKVDDSHIHLEGNVLSFDDPDTQIDLGGIAKGYISAKLKDFLKGQGCESALINLGGNVSTIGTKPDGSSWAVGIQKPFSVRGEVADIIEADDVCVISSGTYERYFYVGDDLYHHILDPQTGYPAVTDLTQVTMIGTDDAACDALATIGIILGETSLNRIVEENGIDVRILYTRSDESMSTYPEA